MTLKIPSILAGAALAAFLLPATPSAQATSLLSSPSALSESQISDVTKVHQRGYRHTHRKRGPRYRGYRGHRHKRPGYRRHRGYWYPPAAFIIGGIINEALRNSDRRIYRGNYSRRHHRWCDNKFRSYRRSDGTFQPYGNRPRKRCNSPYDGR